MKGTKLDYAAGKVDRSILSIRGVVVAIAAGAFTFASAFLVGPCLMWGVCLIAGLVVGYACARFARGNAFAAGLVGNVIAAFAFMVTSFSVVTIWDRKLPIPGDWRELMLTSSIFSGAFIVPGLLGSLWVWEGRRSSI